MANIMVETRIFANQIRAVYHLSETEPQCPLVAIWMMVILVCLQILVVICGEHRNQCVHTIFLLDILILRDLLLPQLCLVSPCRETVSGIRDFRQPF